ncbi:MAG: M13 family metallopeptidase [Bacteroidales bacterium]|nr:M13 family metallopeptidase [Bacteroidales bacterium]
MKRTFFLIAAMTSLTIGCGHKVELTSGINCDNLDTISATPQDNFYQYACGGWMKAHPLDAEHSRYGAFDFLAEECLKQLNTVMDSVSKTDNNSGSLSDKIATFYSIGMDSARLQEQGALPLMPFLEEIAAVDSRTALMQELITMHKRQNFAMFSMFPESDYDDANQSIAWYYQSGLGMGERDYYLTDKGNNRKLREGYLKLMEQEFALAGYDKLTNTPADRLAMMVMQIETKLAKAQYSKLDNRDPYKTFHKTTLAQAKQQAPGIDWEAYLNAMGIDTTFAFNISQPEYMAAVGELLQHEDLESIKAYLAWNQINSAAAYLSDDFVNANFDFYGRQMSGREQNRPRWKRVTSTVDGAMGEAMGKLYVERYFPASAKKRMETLVDNLKTALGQRINMATWMNDTTKQRAQEKLQTVFVKIGYPEKWRDYSALEIKNDSYYANIVRSNVFDHQYMLSKINRPVDRDEWLMTPQTVNAYYNPTTNEICFPAAILQPPFFDMNADEAANYGAIGVVIGHELTHGFDDQGRQYDKDGNLSDWWTAADAENFKRNAKVLVDAFNAVKVLDDPETYANGELTLGENIADNGGLHVSFLAMQNAMKSHQVNTDKMDGFTPEQRFFLAYALVWASNIRDESILLLTNNDVHALAKNRVNVTLPHITEFIEAWGIKEGDGMYLAPEQRAMLW